MKGRNVKPVTQIAVTARAPAAASNDAACAPATVTAEVLPRPVPLAKSPPATINKCAPVMRTPPSLTLIPTPVPQPAQESSAPAATSEPSKKANEKVVVAESKDVHMEAKETPVFVIDTLHEQVHVPVGEPSQEPTFGAAKIKMSSTPQFTQKEID
eukprot:3320479-Amphidinium_carterae.3